MASQPNPHGEFAQLRSSFMDAFARLEIAVGRRIRDLGLSDNAGKRCFEQSVKTLAKAKPGPRLSKVQAIDLGRLPHDCEPLRRLRASMVHGVMEIATTGGGPVAIFRNAVEVIDGGDTCHALNFADLRRRIEEIAAIVKRVEPVSPSSPPRPRPGATTCP